MACQVTPSSLYSHWKLGAGVPLASSLKVAAAGSATTAEAGGEMMAAGRWPEVTRSRAVRRSDPCELETTTAMVVPSWAASAVKLQTAESPHPATMGPGGRLASGVPASLPSVPSLLLLPTSLQANRAARRRCDAAGGLLVGGTVTTLDLLVTRLLVSAREPRPVLTPLGERLLAVEAGNAAGGALAGLAPGSGLAGALAATLSELRAGEVTAAVARDVAATLPGAAAARLQPLSRALAAWEARLARLRVLDRAGALRAAAEAVRSGAPIDDGGGLEGLELDGFTSLTAAEWALVRALVERAPKSLFRIPHFASDPELAGPTVRLMARVESTFDLLGERDVEIDTGDRKSVV